MRVLWFSNTPALGAEYLNKDSKIKGTGGWMYSLNSALQRKVALSLVFHYPYKVADFTYQQTNYYPAYTGNIILENLKKRFFRKVYDADFLTEYLSIIEKVKPDLIHIHGTENSFLCIIGQTDIPIAISIQGNLTVITHKFLSGFHGRFMAQKSGGLDMKTLLFGRNSFRKGFTLMKKMAAIERNRLKGAKHIIGRTDWDRRVTRILAPHSKYYVGNELLRDGFYKNKWDNMYASGRVVLFTTNGDSYYKGFETLCHALHLLNGMGLEVEWRVAGVSGSGLIHKISRKHLGVNYPETGLVLLGALDENELIKNLKESHIYIMPSHIENSPNNLCEAMIIGMPCIATFAGGTGSMLEDGKEGILIQDGDPWAMAGAVIELIHNPEKALQYAKNAGKRATERHDKELIIANLVRTYTEIIENQE